MVVQLTADELAGQIAARVAELADREPAREWMTIAQTAEYLGCSRSMLGRLREQGLPVAMLGDSPRVHRATLDSWLLARAGSAAEAAE